MKPPVIRSAVFVIFLLAFAFGLGQWSLHRRAFFLGEQSSVSSSGAVSRSGGVEAGVITPPAPQTAAAPAAADEQAALREDWRAGEHRLAVAQQEALEGVPEAELAAALANFAEIRRQSLEEAAALALRLNQAASVGAVRPEAAAARARFAAIRHALAEQAISLEEAEVRFPAVSPPP